MSSTEKGSYGHVVVQPGKYWLSDPCYTLGHKEGFNWSEDFCKPMFALEAVLEDRGETFRQMLKVPVKGGFEIAVSCTAYGDGDYRSNIGKRFPVDAGIIGLVPFEMVPNLSEEEFVLVEFEHPTVCFYENGNLNFGHICIYTGDSCSYDYDEDEDDYEEDEPF